MILFLDVISPVPKFVITDNNKVVESLYILDQNCSKISDIIHEKFITLQKKYDLSDILNCLIVCTGPGSFTSLRVGISFMLGISYSKKIPIYGISCTKLLSQCIVIEDFYTTIIIICSSNNQNYICLPINHKHYKYNIINIINKHPFDKFNLQLYTKCISNINLPDFLKKELYLTNKKLEYINCENKLHEIFFSIKSYEDILQPIYISDNKLFD